VELGVQERLDLVVAQVDVVVGGDQALRHRSASIRGV
jgi:hypothetical protein